MKHLRTLALVAFGSYLFMACAEELVAHTCTAACTVRKGTCVTTAASTCGSSGGEQGHVDRSCACGRSATGALTSRSYLAKANPLDRSAPCMTDAEVA